MSLALTIFTLYDKTTLKVLFFNKRLNSEFFCADCSSVRPQEDYLNMSAMSNKFAIDSLKKGPEDIIESIKNYIVENECPSFSMDISNLNIFDASRIAVLCSTYHWEKYPNGEIKWFTNAPELKNIVKPLSLGNIKLVPTE